MTAEEFKLNENDKEERSDEKMEKEEEEDNDDDNEEERSRRVVRRSKLKSDAATMRRCSTYVGKDYAATAAIYTCSSCNLITMPSPDTVFAACSILPRKQRISCAMSSKRRIWHVRASRGSSSSSPSSFIQ